MADVYARVTNFLGSVSRRKNKHIIVVTHGITGRALIMRILRHTPEWFESSVNLPNASIYRITKTLNTKGNLEWHGAFTYGGFGKSITFQFFRMNAIIHLGNQNFDFSSRSQMI